MGHHGWHHAHHYHSVGSRHFGRHICNLLCCIFCIGPILALTGLGLLISSLTDYRTPHIINYNSAVLAWTDPFTSLAGSYENTVGYLGTQRLSVKFNQFPPAAILSADSWPDDPLTDYDSRILDYENYVRYESAGFILNMTGRCSEGTPFYGCDTSNILGSFVLSLNKTNLAYTLPAFTVTKQSASSKSSCASGEWWDSWDQTCNAYSVISTVCVKLGQYSARSTAWYADTTLGGVGCGIDTWDAATYRRLYLYTSADFPKMIEVSISVRSALDPRIAFYGEMGAGHSLDFGSSQGDRATTGIILLSIGGTLLFCLCCTCCRLSRLDKAHTHYEHVRAPDPVLVPVATVQPVYYQQPVQVYGQPAVYAAAPGYQSYQVGPGYQQVTPGYPAAPPPAYQTYPPGQQLPPGVYAPHQ